MGKAEALRAAAVRLLIARLKRDGTNASPAREIVKGIKITPFQDNATACRKKTGKPPKTSVISWRSRRVLSCRPKRPNFRVPRKQKVPKIYTLLVVKSANLLPALITITFFWEISPPANNISRKNLNPWVNSVVTWRQHNIFRWRETTLHPIRRIPSYRCMQHRYRFASVA